MPDAPASDKLQPTISLLSYNLFFANTNKTQESLWLAQTPQDIIFLTEATPAWNIALKTLESSTEHCQQYADTPFGIALFSRQPLKSCEVLYPPDKSFYPYIRAELANGLVIYGIHPPPPIGRQLAQSRDRVLQFLAKAIAAEKQEVIILGDMNITPFSPAFRHFMQAGGPHLSGPRARPTWWPRLLSIDHILVRHPENVIDTGTYPRQGSDHRPVWLTINQG